MPSMAKRDTVTFSAQPLRVAGQTHVSLSQPRNSSASVSNAICISLAPCSLAPGIIASICASTLSPAEPPS
jgi:hypothetical protein